MQAEQPAARERRQLDDEQEGERDCERRLPAVAALEAEVHRREREQRDDEHHAEVVGIAGDRVRPVDVRALDRAVDVDVARAAGDRRQDRLVEARPRPREHELQEPVRRVDDHAGGEEPERLPVERPARAGEVRDAHDEEQEVDGELRHALPVLRGGDGGVEPEVADEVDEEERDEEAGRHDRRPRHTVVAAGEPIGREAHDEADRADVREVDLAGDVPVDLLERHREDRRQEEEASEPHASSCRRSASSRTRVRRSSLRRSSGVSGVPSSEPPCQRVVQRPQRLGDRAPGRPAGRRRRPRSRG